MLDVRADFPIFKQKVHGKPLIYLDTAATAQKPQMVIDAIATFYQNHYGTVHRAIYALAKEATERYQAVREQVRYFINAVDSSEIIFTKGTTEGINLVASSFGKAFVKPKDEILITAMEHHSNIVPWQMLCEERGALLKVVPINEAGELDLDIYRNLLTERTKLVAVTHVSNVLGTVNPIAKMVEWAHSAGAAVLVDVPSCSS